MSKPYLKLKVSTRDGVTFALSFDNSIDMEITWHALEKSGHTCEKEYPHLGGVAFTPWLMESISRGVMNDRINTIKMVRVISRVGLKEAKDFVDDYMS